jgi:hypothetical protein
MKTHLTDLELVAIAERRPGANGEVSILPHEAAHLDTCAPCRETLAGLRDALDAASSVEIPEPSPLFWDHFSARVRSGVRETEIGGGWRMWMFGTPSKIATAALFVAAIAVGATTMWRPSTPSTSDRPNAILGTAGSDAHKASADNALWANDLDADADNEWALVRAVADEVSLEDTVAAGCLAAPGSVDEAALGLTPAERRELARILREETTSGA